MSAIDVKNLVKKFHGQTVLHGIDLEVEQGKWWRLSDRAVRENDAAAQY
jgi:ABC-type sugar transport system ATPase subunit